jgi:hypothetical protein
VRVVTRNVFVRVHERVGLLSSNSPCAGALDFDASEVATRQGREGWYEGVGDQARTATKEGMKEPERE